MLRDIGELDQGPDWRFTIESWFREISDYPVTNVYIITPGTGHFTQMVWADTDTVGCGMVIHRSSQHQGKLIR